MICQDILLRTVPWHIRVYYAVTTYYADEIIDDLIAIGCRGGTLIEAKNNLWSGHLDTGLTYANPDRREAIMVIGKASNGGQFYNSLIHEQLHLLSYIAKKHDLDPYGEEIAYVAGELGNKMYSKAKGLICDCCRPKQYKKII